MARTPGATSCVLIPLKKLNEVLGPEALIPVSRRFANGNQLLGKAEYATPDNVKALVNPPAVEEHTINIREIE